MPDMGNLLCLRYAWVRRLKLIRPSWSPQEIQSSLSILAAFAGSGANSSGGLVFGAEENPPLQAKGSR